MEPIPRPEFCAVCRKPLTQGNRGRPRTTCGSRCRKRKERAPNWRVDEFYQKTRKAWQTIKGWERRFGALTQTYPEWAGLNLRDRLLIRLQRGWPILFCAHCERPYMPDAPDATSRLCSQSCKANVRGGRVKAKGKKLTDPVIRLREQHGALLRRCKHCGVKFAPRNSLHYYHSHACRSAAYRKRWRKCIGCGKRFERTKSNRVYCNQICVNNQSRKRTLQAFYDSLPTQFCVWCGDPIPRRTLGSKPRKYCKSKCRNRHSVYRTGKSSRLPRKSPLRANLDRPALPPLYRR